MMQIEILYEDEDIIVCRKPAGVATQTKRPGQQDMESLLRNHRVQNGETPYIGVVHRLDQPVEGVMVFGKNRRASSELSRQVRERQIGKKYYAYVTLSDDFEFAGASEGTLTDYMTWNPGTNVAQIVEPQRAEAFKAKKAVLDYRVLSVEGRHALLDITLHTGRHHQIRLQLAHLGCPILGDKKYGGDSTGGSLALCAYRLQFEHPRTHRKVTFSIEPENPKMRKEKNRK